MILSIILLILLLILFLPLKIVALVEGKDISVKITLGGVRVFKLTPGHSKKKDESTEEIVDKITEKSESLCDKIKFYSELSKTGIKLTRKFIGIDFISLKVNIGTDDAPSTAICTGALWSVIYQILGVLGNIMYIKKHEVDVVPHFNESKFDANGKCIIKSRPAYIIFIAIIIFIKIKTLKGKED